MRQRWALPHPPEPEVQAEPEVAASGPSPAVEPEVPAEPPPSPPPLPHSVPTPDPEPQPALDLVAHSDLEGGDLERTPGEETAALASLSGALDASPDDPDLLVERGRRLARQQQWEEATADLRRAVWLSPDHWDGWDALGSLYWRRGRPEEAAECYRRVADGRPSADAHLALGKALLHINDLTGAMQALKQAGDIDPDRGEIYRLMGGIFDRLGRSDDATAFYRQALECARQ